MDPLNVQEKKNKINLKHFLFFIFLKILSKFVGHGKYKTPFVQSNAPQQPTKKGQLKAHLAKHEILLQLPRYFLPPPLHP